VAKSRDRQAVEDLVMQYRIERASRWGRPKAALFFYLTRFRRTASLAGFFDLSQTIVMGKIGLLIFALAAVAGVISLFRPKYL